MAKICVRWSMGLCNGCNMGMGDLPDMYARGLRATGRGLRAYISGKSQMAMLQVLCITLFP